MEDLYGDAPGTQGAPGPEPAEPEEQEKPKDDGGETAIIPKALLAGKEFKPGEEVVFQIVRFHDDSVEIKYATDESGKGEDYKESGAEPAGNPGENYYS